MPENYTRAPCRTCHTITKHEVLYSRTKHTDDEIENIGPIWWDDTYDLLECAGCESISLRESSRFSEEPAEEAVAYYPPRVSRRKPPWTGKLPVNMRLLLAEVYNALDGDNRRLALMGARTVVDLLIIDKVGDVGTFNQKLNTLQEKGFVTGRGRDFLAAALDAGHAAAHRGFKPKPSQLAQAMDIIENMLQTVYVIEDAATELRASTPTRESKRPAKG